MSNTFVPNWGKTSRAAVVHNGEILRGSGRGLGALKLADMGNELLTPPEEAAQKELQPSDHEPELLLEADGSMWSSLISNLRDAFSSPKQPPLELTSTSVDIGDLLDADGSMWSSLVANVRDVFSPPKQPPLQLTSSAVEVADPLKQEPIWKEMIGSLQDAFFPRKLPPLELTSTPIPTKDLLYEKKRPLPLILSIVTYAAIIGVFAFFLYRKIVPVTKPAATLTNVDVSEPPIAPVAKLKMGGGGGGGDHDLVQVSKGKLPKFAKDQIAPPQVMRIDHPKLAVEPTVIMPPNIKIPDTNMPNLGLPSSNQVTVASNGGGSGGGMGSGSGGGLGQGSGGGVGPGSGGGYGGGVYQVGGGVSPPSILYSVEPEFSDEARRAKYQGVCLITFIVDAQGNPQHVRIGRAIGMGLDEKAIEAVKQYKFKPAMLQGKPVPVQMSIEVNFRMY